MAGDESVDMSESDLRRIQFLIQFEDELLNVKDHIVRALRENVIESGPEIDYADTSYALMRILELEIDDDDDAEALSYLLLSLVSSPDFNIVDLKERGASREFLDFLFELFVKFQVELADISIRRQQGPQYWSNISTDFVLRSPDNTLGMNHKMVIAHEDEVEFTTDVNSTLRLAYYFVLQSSKLAEEFEEDALNQMDEETLRSILEHTEMLLNKRSQTGDQTNEQE